MSGPKYYKFDFACSEEASEVFAQLSSFPSGVKITVVNNELQFVVAEQTWWRGVTWGAIKDKIEKAKQICRENKLLQMFLKNKNKAKLKVTQKIDDIKQSLEAVKRKTAQTKAVLQQLKAQTQTSLQCKLGTLNMDSQTRQVQQLIDELVQYVKSEESQYSKCVSECDRIADEIESCQNSIILDVLLGRLSMVQLPQKDFNDRVQSLTANVRNTKQTLAKVKQFLDNLYNTVCQTGFDDCIPLIKQKVASLDMTQQSSCDVVYKYTESLLQQRRTQKVQDMLAKSQSQIDDLVDSQMSQLLQLKAELSNIEVAFLNQQTEEDYSVSNGKLLQQCREQLAKADGLQFVSRENKGKLKAISANLDGLSNLLQLPSTQTQLRKLSLQLSDILTQCVKANEQFVRFSAEQQRYAQLYARLQGILSTAKDKDSQSQAIELPDPNEVMLAYGNADKQIAELQQRNEQLNKLVNSAFQESFCQAVQVAVEHSDNSKSFLKEYMEDGSIHYAYVRQQNQGVMFDMQCTSDGKVAVYPRGVRLSNGKLMITPEQLQQTYKSCDWAQDLSQRFEQMGISGLNFSEMSQDVQSSMYSADNYYQLKTYDESVRYLRLSGKSQAEIDAIMQSGDSSDNRSHRTQQQSNSKVVK